MSDEPRPDPFTTWERVADEPSHVVDRLEVPGGWIYRDRNLNIGMMAMVFVPFPPS